MGQRDVMIPIAHLSGVGRLQEAAIRKKVDLPLPFCTLQGVGPARLEDKGALLQNGLAMVALIDAGNFQV